MSRHISVMLRVLPITSLHSLGHNDHNEVEPDFSSHVIPFVPALLPHDANCIISCTIFFIGWRQLKQGLTWLFWACDAIGTSASITWCWCYYKWYHTLDEWNRCNMTSMVMWYLYLHQMILTESSLIPLHFYFKIIKVRCNMTFSVIWHCRH